MDLGVLADVVDGLVGCDPVGLADPESIVELRRQLDRLEALAARATAAFDAAGQWRADGARSAATWLAVWCRRPRPDVAREGRAGRALRHLSVAERAWLAGTSTPRTSACWRRYAVPPPVSSWPSTNRC